MGLIETNLTNEHIAGLVEQKTDGTVGINWGYNSGGYESNAYFVTADGGALGIDTILAEIDKVDFTDASDSQWHVVGASVNYEDEDLVDDHTGKPIPAAYAE